MECSHQVCFFEDAIAFGTLELLAKKPRESAIYRFEVSMAAMRTEFLGS